MCSLVRGVVDKYGHERKTIDTKHKAVVCQKALGRLFT